MATKQGQRLMLSLSMVVLTPSKDPWSLKSNLKSQNNLRFGVKDCLTAISGLLRREVGRLLEVNVICTHIDTEV